MIFKELDVTGAYLIEPNKIEDHRGYFSTLYSSSDFEKVGITDIFKQVNISYNYNMHTLRGLHYQVEPFSQAKLVYCIQGSLYDVIVDLRKNSKTYCKWSIIPLDDLINKMVYIPSNCAHGFITCESNTRIQYQISNIYNKNYDFGVRYDDVAFNIKWPYKPKIISKRDLNHPAWII